MKTNLRSVDNVPVSGQFAQDKVLTANEAGARPANQRGHARSEIYSAEVSFLIEVPRSSRSELVEWCVKGPRGGARKLESRLPADGGVENLACSQNRSRSEPLRTTQSHRLQQAVRNSLKAKGP
jgi:hypothetical protein